MTLNHQMMERATREVLLGAKGRWPSSSDQKITSLPDRNSRARGCRKQLMSFVGSFRTSCVLGPLHTMAKERDAINPHESHCKKRGIWPLNPFHTRGQSRKTERPSKMRTWQQFFDQSERLSKGFWVAQEWKPKLWSRGPPFFCFC